MKRKYLIRSEEQHEFLIMFYIEQTNPFMWQHVIEDDGCLLENFFAVRFHVKERYK